MRGRSTTRRRRLCNVHGLPAYEISNHARPGAECRHNLVYWRGDEYAGVGPGAHGRIDIDGTRRATATEKRPEAWLMRVEQLGHGVVTDDALTSEERADEYLLMGLRLREGIDPQRYRALAGRTLDQAASSFCVRKARSSSTATAACASRSRDFRCSMRWSPIWRRERVSSLMGHDLFGKPVPTFPDHARYLMPLLTKVCITLRCRMKNRISTGSDATVTPAISGP